MTGESVQLPGEILAEADLFRLSGTVDVLRDTAKELLGCDVSPVTLRRMAARYTRLRAGLTKTLTPTAARGLLEWTEELGEEAGSVDEVYDAAAVLARWIDLTLNLPGFVVARRANESEMRDVLRRVDEGRQQGAAPQAGQQYL